jgi:hypothetical protein
MAHQAQAGGASFGAAPVRWRQLRFCIFHLPQVLAELRLMAICVHFGREI